MSEPRGGAADAGEIRHKTYGQIVWGQFCKDRVAVAGTAAIALIFAMAVAAPMLANNKPFVFRDAASGETTFPLIREILAPAPDVSERGLELGFNFVLVWGVFFLLLAWPVRRLTAGLPFPRRRAVRRGACAALFLAVLIPFLTVQPRLDKRDYKADAAAFAPGGGGLAVFPPLRYGPFEQAAGQAYKPPSAAHPMGTDSIGRDIMTRIVHGSRVSLAVGFVAVAIYLFIGVVLGALAGYYGGRTDLVISRALEIMMGFPTFLLILTIIAVFEARSVIWVMLVLGVTGWTGVARLMRGEMLKQGKMDYVTAARAQGVPDRRIMFRHILPNAIAPVLVSATFGIAGTILTETSLAFLGLGVRPPTATWGELLNQSLANPFAYWWLLVFPGLVIFLSILSYNLAGEGLRDAIDPRMRK